VSNIEFTVGAKVVVASHEQTLTPGYVSIRDGRITRVADTCESCNLFFEQAAILPSLINAHTHLEFSDLEKPIAAGDSFPDWIGRVVAYRRQQLDASTDVVDARRRAAIQQGLRESFKTGTGLLADIVTPPWSPDYLQFAADRPRADLLEYFGGILDQNKAASASPQHPLVIALPEIIGMERERLKASLDWAEGLNTPPPDEHKQVLKSLGISPHSPYTIDFSTFTRADQQPAIREPVAMHLAESVEELQWLRERRGPFADAFQRLGVQPPDQLPSIQECLQFLAKYRSLIVHGNYLTMEQMRWIGDHRNLSVVYCPRTHSYFGHAPYPLQEMQNSGIRVVLGTDSRASSPDLNMWSELRHLRKCQPWMSPNQALKIATTASADALGCSADVGCIATGKLAFLSIAKLQPQEQPGELLERISLEETEINNLADLFDSSDS